MMGTNAETQRDTQERESVAQSEIEERGSVVHVSNFGEHPSEMQTRPKEPCKSRQPEEMESNRKDTAGNVVLY